MMGSSFTFAAPRRRDTNIFFFFLFVDFISTCLFPSLSRFSLSFSVCNNDLSTFITFSSTFYTLHLMSKQEKERRKKNPAHPPPPPPHTQFYEESLNMMMVDLGEYIENCVHCLPAALSALSRFFFFFLFRFYFHNGKNS